MLGKPAVVLFAKVPRPHRVKTRLARKIGDASAQALHLCFVKDALSMVRKLRSPVTRYLFLDGSAPDRRRFSLVLGLGQQIKIEPQRGLNLGSRLGQAFRSLLQLHSCAVILGVDSPTLPRGIIRNTLYELRVCDAVLGPCPDGGFYLIGLKSIPPRLFRGVRWGTKFSFQDTLQNILDCGLSCAILEEWPDVDRVEDLKMLEREFSLQEEKRVRAPSTARLLREWRVRKIIQ